MPSAVRSTSRPMAFVNAALPSANIRILSPTPWSFAHTSITHASFTDTHTMRSTPLPNRSSAPCT